jgi:hypothetical protein
MNIKKVFGLIIGVVKIIVIYCISVLDSILSTQEFLTASANARAFNILKWIICD